MIAKSNRKIRAMCCTNSFVAGLGGGKLMDFVIRQLVQFAVAIVMLLGLLVAATNLPVFTHCAYYSQCSSQLDQKPLNTSVSSYTLED
ncbi:hypothetical protein [Croceicoccus sp. Ery5]|uniref:hypothetical protein n=1 Tax=Croceicoccus sp. Ery5 TaxID=1703340 RepID=UPI001E39BB27|nr:hypothetical protein [Croceicoccus sp. Ery5]